jgi:thiazole synthase
VDILKIGGIELNSRLFVGTGKFSSNKIIPEVIKASGTDVVTAALRRVDFDGEDDNIINYIDSKILMPNTSGARNAEEAIRLARLARSAGCGNWIKVEVISDNKYLLPDNYETTKAVEVLAKEGFIVLPYMNPDLIDGRRMADAGAAAIMPLGSPIGTNRGIRTVEMIRILIEEIKLPIVVDAGIGRPSDAVIAMEMGASAVLVNTALATAKDPVLMAEAFKNAVEAGRKGYLAKMGVQKKYADASSPLTGFLR